MNEQVIEQPEVPDTSSPLVIDHGDRISEQHVETPSDGPSELELHKQARSKPAEAAAQPDVTEPAAEQTPEPKKPERWKDPETGDTYDMRHKVARRIKQVLEKAAKAEERAQKAEAERERFMRAALEGRRPQPEPQKPVVDANAEPDPSDTTKYPEGQYDRAYIRDVALWAADQKANATAQSLRTERVQEQMQAAESRVIAQWQQTLPEAQKRYPDFADKLAMFPNTREHEPIKEMLFGSPVGNDVVYAVGADPQLYRAYNGAPNERSRVRLLAHVEAQILARRGNRPAPTAKTTSAPAPIQPVHAGQGPSGPMDWSKDDPDQFQRWKQNRKRS